MEDTEGIKDAVKEKEVKIKYLKTFSSFVLIAGLGFCSALICNYFFTLEPIIVRILRCMAVVIIATAVHSRMAWRNQSYGGVNSWEILDSRFFRWSYYFSIFISSFSFVINEIGLRTF